jgi:hypothetical protein
MRITAFASLLILAPALVVVAAPGCSDDEPAGPGSGGSGAASSSSDAANSSVGVGGNDGGAGSAQGGAGQGGTGGGTGGAGQGGAGGGCSTGQGGAADPVDPDDPCASTIAPRVAFVVEGDPQITLEGDVSLLWSFQFVVAVPESHPEDFTLEHVRCTTFAGEAENCMTIPIPIPAEACSVMFTPKFGADPSEYNEGDNLYYFAVRLLEGCQVVSEDYFTTVLTYDPM